MSKVLNLHINRKRLAIVLEDRIHIYDITTMKLLHSIDTLPNSSGVSTMSSDSESSVLAYPSNSSTGEITIFDCINLRPLSILKAHKTAVTRMTFNQKGDLLATASDKVIKLIYLIICLIYSFREQLLEYLKFRRQRSYFNFVEAVCQLTFIIWPLMLSPICFQWPRILIRFIYSSLQLSHLGTNAYLWWIY